MRSQNILLGRVKCCHPPPHPTEKILYPPLVNNIPHYIRIREKNGSGSDPESRKIIRIINKNPDSVGKMIRIHCPWLTWMASISSRFSSSVFMVMNLRTIRLRTAAITARPAGDGNKRKCPLNGQCPLSREDFFFGGGGSSLEWFFIHFSPVKCKIVLLF